MPELAEDVVMACADLAGRAGASEFEMAWDCPHVPDEPEGHSCEQTTWAAHAAYRGARIQTAGHRSPTAVAMALAERLLSGATCRCGKRVALSDRAEGCRWRLVGKRWQPGCDAEPLHVKGERGDMSAMQRALAESGNRAQRRAAAKRKRGGRRG